MITRDQIALLAKTLKTNEPTILREYLQVWFLSRLYSFPKSENIFFKGGTALHLIFGCPRFSEDLDFTVDFSAKRFSSFIEDVFKKVAKEEAVEFKERKTIAGKRFLLTASPSIVHYRTFVSLDFSFREKVLDPKKSIVKSPYPVLFTTYLYHLSKEEIFAEKIRAVLTRERGRDIYDLWFLLNSGVLTDNKLVKNKLKHYHLEEAEKKDVIARIEDFSREKFILDLRPFVPLNEREKLGSFFEYLRDYLNKNLNF